MKARTFGQAPTRVELCSDGGALGIGPVMSADEASDLAHSLLRAAAEARAHNRSERCPQSHCDKYVGHDGEHLTKCRASER